MKRVPCKIYTVTATNIKYHCKFCCLSYPLCQFTCLSTKNLKEPFYYPEIWIKDHE